MKIRFKTDNTNIIIKKDGKIEGYKNSDTQEAAFCEIDLDFLYMAYKMFPPSIIDNNYINKAIEKYLHMYSPAKGYPADTIKKFPVTGHDIYNYVARFGSANFQIQAVMALDGKLSHSKLLRAIRLSLDEEPVFGCRLVESEPPYWKRLDNIDKVTFCSFQHTDDPKGAVKKFLESPLDMDKDPMVKLKLISSGQYDTLCMKINHTCCDGTGTKEYIRLISDIYSRIDNNEDFIPNPKMRSRKDQDILFNTLGIKDPDSAWNPLLDIPKTMWTFPWRLGQPDIARVATCRLSYGQLDLMSRYGKARGASINDLLLTALYRAMFEMSQPLIGIPMDISLTVDLRRYLPDQKTEAIRNFSGGFDTRIVRIANEPFEGTLSRVVTVMNEVKNGRPGLQSAIGLERVEKAKFNETLDYYRVVGKYAGLIDKCAPVLSNLGYIDKSIIKFGNTTVTDAYIVPPAVSAPGLLLCIGTYNDVITMSISYYESQIRRDNIENLLKLIKKELMEGCKG